VPLASKTHIGSRVPLLLERATSRLGLCICMGSYNTHSLFHSAPAYGRQSDTRRSQQADFQSSPMWRCYSLRMLNWSAIKITNHLRFYESIADSSATPLSSRYLLPIASSRFLFDFGLSGALLHEVDINVPRMGTIHE
jgi:hypothetical protein